MSVIDRARERPAPSTTFLFCVESGHFEAQTLLSVECLRRFGGRFADAPVMAVTPRFGPPLTRATLRRFADLGVEYVHVTDAGPFGWFPYTNKARAAKVADERASTEQVIWLDSDVLVVAEPNLLALAPDEDFTICSVDKNVGSSGPDDPNEPFWAALATSYGVALDRLPWVETQLEKTRVRFRLHSGVYAFRRGRGLGAAFRHDLEAMLASRIVYSTRLPFPGDDVALAFSITRLGLAFRMLPMAYNYEMEPQSRIYRRGDVPGATILHYHHTLTRPEGCTWFLGELAETRPDVAAWLRSRLPLDPRVGGWARTLLRRALREGRNLQRSAHLAQCRTMIVD